MFEPIEETRLVLRALSRTSGLDLERKVQRLAQQVAALVPACVGLSVTVSRLGLTFTVVDSSESAAALDALQYLEGGPCVDTALTGEPNDVPDVLDEERWHRYALGAAAEGVRSSLSLPVDRADGLQGAVNVYASSARAFVGKEDAIRALLGGDDGAVVLNADLAFRTREQARAAPQVLEDRDVVERAVGFLAAAHRVGVDAARGLLHDAALRGGIDVAAAARRVLAAGDSRPED